MTSLDDLAPTLDRLVDDGHLAGWVAGTSDGTGSTIRHGGRRALDGDTIDGDAMSADTQFALSSTTKPIGGVLALRLVEQGTLALDDPIGRWIHELAEPRVLTSPGAPLDDTVPAERPITVHHLLTMTPGFGWVAEPGPLADALSDLEIEPGPWGPAMSPDDFAARLGSLPLAEQPGTAWRYHTSSDLLGVLLARATGRSVADLLAEHVLGPLGMTDTSFVGDPDRMATAYGPADEGGITPFPVPPGTYTEQPPFESLAAGLVSTVPDQLAFLGTLAGTGPALLHPSTLTQLRTDHLTEAQRSSAAGFLDPGCGWGYQVEVRTDGLVGWAGGLGTIGYADPRTGRAAVLATQVSFEGRGTTESFDRFWSLFA
ncbi:MAG TPA: beta-lactamase family protein [Candidatus Janibacter merdipullorum]|nr:beta-lactamase family protein [Candidatus Janibacter merdipullorum]